MAFSIALTAWCSTYQTVMSRDVEPVHLAAAGRALECMVRDYKERVRIHREEEQRLQIEEQRHFDRVKRQDKEKRREDKRRDEKKLTALPKKKSKKSKSCASFPQPSLPTACSTQPQVPAPMECDSVGVVASVDDWAKDVDDSVLLAASEVAVTEDLNALDELLKSLVN